MEIDIQQDIKRWKTNTEIVLNERKRAAEIIKTGNIGDKPSASINLIARYYRQDEGIKGKRLFKKLNDFMISHYRNYNPVKWSETLEKFVSQAAKFPLIEIDYVPITQKELDKIAALNSRRLERLMFTMLCVAKFYDLKNPNNNHWVNQEDKTIFTLAATPMSKHDQNIALHDLYKAGYIAFSRKVDNLNSQVLIVDDDSPIVLKINDFRKLGYEYMLHKGANYVRCRNCGMLTKQNKNGTRQFCDNCVGYKPMETKTVVCEDCGQLFITSAKNNKSTRCDICQAKRDREKATARKRKQRECHGNN